MMDNITTYPDSLPLPQSNFSGSISSPVVTTQFSSGRIRRRKFGRVTSKKASMEWLFSPEEYDLFVAWWEYELESGTSRFSINVCTGGTGQTGEHVVQFIDDPSFSHEECNWRVSVPCIIYPYPSVDEDAILELYLGHDPYPLFEIINMYYESEYI